MLHRIKRCFGRLDAVVDGVFRPLVTFVETRAFFTAAAMISGIFGLVVLVMTAFQIQADLTDRAVERAERNEEAIARAWERLLSPAAGNTGKGDFLSFLIKAGRSVEGVDLSCRAIGNWNSTTGKCDKRVIFSGVELQSIAPDDIADIAGPNVIFISSLTGLDFSDAEIGDLKITQVSLFDFVFERASLRALEAYRGSIEGNFQGAKMMDCMLVSTTVVPAGDPPSIENCNISNAILPWLNTETVKSRRLFAWADYPPLKSGGNDSTFNYGEKTEPHAMEVLALISLCEPRTAETGELIPLEDRGWGDTFLGAPCTAMSLTEAIAKYPDAYKTRPALEGEFFN